MARKKLPEEGIFPWEQPQTFQQYYPSVKEGEDDKD